MNALEKVIFPIVDFIIFGGKNQSQNQRNTVTYDKEQKRAILEDGLAIY